MPGDAFFLLLKTILWNKKKWENGGHTVVARLEPGQLGIVVAMSESEILVLSPGGCFGWTELHADAVRTVDPI